MQIPRLSTQLKTQSKIFKIANKVLGSWTVHFVVHLTLQLQNPGSHRLVKTTSICPLGFLPYYYFNNPEKQVLRIVLWLEVLHLCQQLP